MLLETFRIAINSLTSNKLRSFLSMLGIIIGVGAVIAIISIATGSTHEVTSNIADLGSNMIMIKPGMRRGGFGRLSSTAQNLFTLELGEAINDYCPSVKGVIPDNQTYGHFMVGDNNISGSLVGTSTVYQEINNYNPEMGKFFSEYDLDNSRSVIVLGSKIAEELYEGENPIGQKITFNVNNQFHLFNVIGVMEEKEMGFTSDLNGSAYIPSTTYLNIISGSRYVEGFLAQAVSAEKAEDAVSEIEYLLSKYFGNEDDYNLMSQEQLLDMINSVVATMTVMLGGIAAISLLVGGIGIMNIMLVSVTERTREIGIRKALGAKRKYIMTQFLLEAVTISGIGGMIGIVLGSLGAYGVSLIGGWPFDVAPISIIIAFGFSFFVGIISGIYPAVKASRLDPVEALSYE